MQYKNHRQYAAVAYGKVVFEFFNNDDENYKIRSLKTLCKELRKEFNSSATMINESIVENPEHGAIVFSLTRINMEEVKIASDKLLAYIDSHCPGRIISDNLQFSEME